MSNTIPVSLADLTPTLQLVNHSGATQRLDYILPDGTVDTVEVYAGQRALVPTENLVTVPSIAVFTFEEPNLTDPDLQTVLGLPNTNTVIDLLELLLTTASFAENSAQGMFVGSLTNMTPGSTLRLTSSAGNRLALDGFNLRVGPTPTNYEVTPSLTIVVREELGAVSRDTSFEITITDVYEPVPMDFVALTLSANTVSETAAADTLVGVLQNRVTDSELSVVSGGSLFGVSNGRLYTRGGLDYETATSHTVVVREQDPYFANNRRDTSLLVNVQNVLEVVLGGLSPVTLNLLDNVAAGATLTTLSNRTAGSTLTLQNAANRVALNPATGVITRGTGALSGNFSFDVVETHPDAAPRTTTINVTVVASTGTPLAITATLTPNLVEPVAANAVLVDLGYTVGANPRPATIDNLTVTIPVAQAGSGATLVTLP